MVNMCVSVLFLACFLHGDVMGWSSTEYVKKSNPVKREAADAEIQNVNVLSERDHQPSNSRDSNQYTQIDYGKISSGHTPPESMSSLQNKQGEKLMKRFEKIRDAIREIIEFLRTDGHPGTMPSAGISWFALATAFIILSPMLVPLILSPLVLVIGFFVFLPTIIEYYQNEG